MLMSYIGALKAYLYFPIFKLFGVCRKYKTASYINFLSHDPFLARLGFPAKKVILVGWCYLLKPVGDFYEF
jgi:hypothetical protein